MGIKIDIFPIDGVPEDDTAFYKITRKINTLRWILWKKKQKVLDTYKLRGVKSAIKQLVCTIMFAPIPYSFIQKKIKDIATYRDYEESSIVDAIVFNLNGDTRVPKLILEESVLVDFEGRKFYAMKDYDTYLRRIYGDYMQLPPEEQRIAKHDFTAYWK